VVQPDSPHTELNLVAAGGGRGVAIHQGDLTVPEMLERADHGHETGSCKVVRLPSKQELRSGQSLSPKEPKP
jgi:hypothetical protein